MTISERIKQLREQKNIQQKKLALLIGVNQATISYWESGRQEPNPTQRKKLCEVLGITEAELFGEIRYIGVKESKIPIVSGVGATDERGRSSFEAYEPPYDYIDFKNCKAMIVQSDSMAPIAYKGQKIIYCESESVRDGDLVFIKLKNGDQLFKRYSKNHKNMITLESINPVQYHKSIPIKETDIEFCYKVIGIKF